MLRRSKLPLILFCVSLACLGLGCGDDGGGSAADAGDEVDAPDADNSPTSGTCGIVVNPIIPIFDGVPSTRLADHPVVFSNPDGTLIGVEATDMNGAAERDDCVPNTIVTAVIPASLRYPRIVTARATDGGVANGLGALGDFFAVTYTNVQIGDTVYYGDLDVTPVPIYATRDINVTVPGTAGFDADEAYVSTGCAKTDAGAAISAGATIPMLGGVAGDCVNPDGTIDVYAVLTEQTGSGDRAIAYTFANDIVPMLDGSTVVNLPAWTPGDVSTASTLANFAPETLSGRITTWHQISAFVINEGFSDNTALPIPPSIGGTFFGTPPGFGTVSVTTASSSRGSSIGLGGAVSMLRRVEDLTPTVFVDGTSDLLPYVIDGIITAPIPTRPQLNWVLDRPLTGGDMTVGLIQLEPTYVGDAKPPVIDDSYWLIITPRSSEGFVQAPELPAESLALLFPSDTVVQARVLGVELIDSNTATYQDMITTQGFQPDLNAPVLPSALETGTFRASLGGRLDANIE